MEVTQNKIGRSDLLGVTASGLCAIHCTLTPLLFAAKPVMDTAVGEHAHGSAFWAILDYAFLALSLVAVWYSARHTSHSTIKWVLWGA
ncbi:MAG: MerC domain-containing protein, partial [Bacteroidota bacterium]